jgi:hypothetical protein
MALIGTDVFHQVRSLGKSAHHEQKTNQLSALSQEIIRCSTFEQIPLPTRVICKPFYLQEHASLWHVGNTTKTPC